MRPVYSSWLERLKEFQEAKRLVDLMLKAWVAVAREVAEDFPEEALREIAEEAKKVGLSAKTFNSPDGIPRTGSCRSS